MIHQWSILFHGQRNGRLSIVRRRDIDPIAAGGGSDAPADAPPADGAPSDGASPADGLTDSLAGLQDDATPAQPNFEDLFKDPEPDAPAPVDPNAPPTEVPKEFQEALGISEFVKEPGQVANAVRAADEVWGVETGRIPAHQMLENLRARNPDGFSKIVTESLIPYIETITGKKLSDPGSAPAAEKTPEQQRIDAIEQRFQQQEQHRQQQEQQQVHARYDKVFSEKANDALKGTWLEGKAENLINQIVPHIPMSHAQAVQAVLSGNTAVIDKAVKSMMAQKEAEGRAYAKWKIAESKTLKAGLPAGKGNPRVAAPGELPEGATMADKIAYLNAAS